MAQLFGDLLLRYSPDLGADEKAEIERRLWDEYGATIAALVVDMSGFTRLTRVHGIVHYLSMVRRMQVMVGPIVEGHGGAIVKFSADNTFARFDRPLDAIRASIALNHALDSANLLTPAELDLHVSCGIDYGECLIPHPSDFFGRAVNRASKLGEDIGQPGEILVTREAMALVAESAGIRTEPVQIALEDEDIIVHSVIYSFPRAGPAGR